MTDDWGSLETSECKADEDFSSTTTAGGECHTCPVDEPCCYTTMKLSTGKRGYDILLPPHPEVPRAGEVKVLASDNSGSKITASLDTEGCSKGLIPPPLLRLEGNSENYDKFKNDAARVEFEARYPEIDWTSDGWWPYLWPLDATPRTVTIHTDTCDYLVGPERVHIYPDIKWDIGVSIGYVSETEETLKSKPETPGLVDYQESKKKGWNLSGQVKLTYGSTELDLLKGSFEKYVKSALVFLNVVKEGTEHVGKILRNMGNVKFTLLWPKIGLNVSYYAKELNGKPDLDYAFKVKVSASPIFGASGSTDILDWLIQALNGVPGGQAVAPILLKAKKQAAEGVEGMGGQVKASASIGVIATLTGVINGEVEWEKELSAGWTSKGQLEGKVSLQLKGEAKATIDAFIVSFSGAASTAADSAIGAKFMAGSDDPKGVYVNGQLYWDGLKLTFLLYASGSLGTKSANDYKKRQDEYWAKKSADPVQPSTEYKSYSTHSNTPESNVGTGAKQELYKEEVVIFKRRAWPKDGDLKKTRTYVFGGA